MTGHTSGAIRVVEVKLDRPVQRAPCLFHAAEKPALHLVRYFDGETTSPIGTNGEIGQAIKALDRFQGPFVRFTQIRGNDLPALDQNMIKMLADQEDMKCMFRFAHGISSGRVPRYLENKKPVHIDEARWKNYCTRIMSVYCRTRNPSRALKIIVTFIIKAYVPMIMDVFFKPELWNGSIHWFNYLKRAQKCLNRTHFNFVSNYFYINGGHFHPENMLLCGYYSPMSPPDTKARALEKLLDTRTRYQEHTGVVRKFKNPKQNLWNLNTDNFFDFLNWDEIELEDLSFPPVLRNSDNDKLIRFEVELARFLCHSQVSFTKYMSARNMSFRQVVEN